MKQPAAVRELIELGKSKQARSTLTRLLEKCFGRLSRTDRERIKAGSQADLERWTLRAVDAASTADALEITPRNGRPRRKVSKTTRSRT